MRREREERVDRSRERKGKRSREKRVERSRQKRVGRSWENNKKGQNNQNVYENGDRREQKPRDQWTSKKPTPVLINRSQTCPFLVRIFYAVNDVNQYSKDKPLPSDREIHLYLWMNMTLKEIVELIRAHLPSIRTKQRFVLSRVHSGEEGRIVKKELGTVMVHKKGEAGDEQTLEGHSFRVGDFIDASINYK